MDLTGQLSNLPAGLEKLFELPLPRPSDARPHRREGLHPIFQQRTYERIRDALVKELPTESAGLRLMEIRRRVEERLGEPVEQKRFRDYVNDQSRGTNPLVERLGWGTYRLRP